MTLKVGIVGCGDIFPAHVKGWNDAGECEVRAVFDTDPSALHRAGEHPGVKGASGSLAELIDTCDVVDICTPPASHAEIALAAMRHRRHLLIEKPVVLTIAEWDQLVDKATETGARICAMFNQKFLPQVLLARRWIDEGRIGQVIRVRTEAYRSPRSDWMLGNSRHWAHTLPGRRWFETLPHDLYLVRFLAGPVEVSSVSALQGTGAAPLGHADEVVVTLKGKSCLAEVQYSANCDRHQRNIVVTGSRGTIEITGGMVTTLSTLRPSRWKQEIGMSFLEAGEKLTQLIPDRIRWWSNRLRREPPHSRLIAAAARYFEGAGPSPTALDEIGNVVDCCEVAGRQIELELATTTTVSPAGPGAGAAPGNRVPSEAPRVFR